MFKSAKEYVLIVLKVWWAMIVLLVGDVMGIVASVTGKVLLVPAWVWWVIGTGGLVAAQFVVFHRVSNCLGY